MNPWNERFQGEEYVYGTEPNAFVVDMQSRLSLTGQTLAIAEGEGRNAVYLAEQGHDVTVWDYAEAGLNKANKLAKEKGVKIAARLQDLEDAAWTPDQWDQIVCIFGHFPKALRLRTLRGVKEAVKPGGYFITEVYSMNQIPYQSGGPQEMDMLYEPEDFLRSFADWRIIHFFIGEVHRSEGALHQGLSHVIQFAGQKPAFT
ncbi:methyltransferase domain-containing protein [Paenibacillus sp. FSL K6-1566]|uniref:methyltransferase domain-containing protein n=1 Tax=Paenibacillus sp. FSL K6-1566 TaxID=2954515 RepID=UPI003101806C